MKSDNKNIIDWSDISFGYYLFPLFSYASISILYDESWSSAFVNIKISGWQAIGLGIIFMLIAIYGLIDLLYITPKKYEYSINHSALLKIVFYSPFLYVWLILLIITNIFYYHKSQYWFLMFFIYLFSCFIFQRKLKNKIIAFINKIT